MLGSENRAVSVSEDAGVDSYGFVYCGDVVEFDTEEDLLSCLYGLAECYGEAMF